MTTLDSKQKWHKMKFGTEYLSPDYYDQILKKYSTEDGANEDTDMLADFMKGCPSGARILELGCGSGRATKVISEFAQNSKLTVTDLSKQMLDFVRKQQGTKVLRYKNIDHIQYLSETKEQFDVVVSLWSLAHSVFPWYERDGLSAFDFIESVLTKFFTTNLDKKGSVFIIQTDGASEEQILIKKSWFLGSHLSGKGENLETEYYVDFQSPAIRILNKVFEKLIANGTFGKTAGITHVDGNKIEYESMDEALEAFMNFHLEGEFNGTKYFDTIYDFLKNEFEKITTEKGKLSIGTGFWVYRAKKD